MESKEKLLMELLGHTARSLTHLTASMTSMSFELLRGRRCGQICRPPHD